jgi:uncharacterized membrane protein
MSVDIVKIETCDAALDVAFEYVADYRKIPDWMFGVNKFEPVGDKDYGPDSIFDVTLSLGVRIHTVIKAVEWEQDRLIGMDSIKGFQARSRWHFKALGDDRTEITAKVSYDLPFGPAGRAMGKVMAPFVTRAVHSGSHQLKTNIEAAARAA